MIQSSMSMPVKTGRALIDHNAQAGGWVCRFMDLSGEVRAELVSNDGPQDWIPSYDAALVLLMSEGVHRKAAGDYEGPQWPGLPGRARGPMPTVTYDGQAYKVKSRSTVIPDLAAMDRLGALMWLNQNTYRRGYSAAPSPLQGMGGAISLTVR